MQVACNEQGREPRDAVFCQHIGQTFSSTCEQGMAYLACHMSLCDAVSRLLGQLQWWGWCHLMSTLHTDTDITVVTESR